MCMKGLSFLMLNFIMIYTLVLKIYRENLKISAITGRVPVDVLLIIKASVDDKFGCKDLHIESSLKFC